MLDVQIYGMSAGPQHLTNLVIHSLNALLLFGLLCRMTGAWGRSVFVAGLFAVHPLHVESVAWIAERKDVLSVLFWMLTIWAYVAYVRRPRLGRYLPVLAFFGLGLMAKPMLVTLPFVLLLLDFWPLQRVELVCRAGGFGLAAFRPRGHALLRLVKEKVPLFGLAAISCLATVLAQRRGEAVAPLDLCPFGLRLANALSSYLAYIGKMLWPARLAAFYPGETSTLVWRAGLGVLLLIGVSILAIRSGQRHGYFLVGWLWYLGTLIPVIGVVQVGSQSMADRYTYIPLIGLFLIIAWGTPELMARWRYARLALPAAAACVLLAGAALARAQVRYWSDDTTLWKHALDVTDDNALAHNELGMALRQQGKLDEAERQFVEALRIMPDSAEARNNLGIALMMRGRLDEAVQLLDEALRVKPDFADAQCSLGTALIHQGRLGEAVQHLDEALRLRPDFADAHCELGEALEKQGKLDEGVQQLTEALRLRPGYAEAHDNLGAALIIQGRLDEAIQHLVEAVRLGPDLAGAHHDLGVALNRQGKVDEAIQQYTEAVRLRPDFVEAQFNLGTALAQQGRFHEAIQHYAEAVRLRPDFAQAHFDLGTALAQQGRFHEASQHFAEALRINPDFAAASFNLKLAQAMHGKGGR